jgi:selenocysteine lyase/cysteine desulfurase
VPETVIEAIAGAYRRGIGNVGGAFPASHRSDGIVAECRAAIAEQSLAARRDGAARPAGRTGLSPGRSRLTSRDSLA